MEKKTPMYDCHVSEGGKMTVYADYILPIQYQTGVIEEHNTVRNNVGIFDVSHMGEFTLKGNDALQNLNMILTNDFSNMVDGQIRYSLMCNNNGGIIDDLLVYRVKENEYFIVVNASNIQKDKEHIEKYLKGNVEFKDISENVAQIAIQGPNSEKVMSEFVDPSKLPRKYYSAVYNVSLDGIPCTISTTGYTGEIGYEIYCDSNYGAKLWKSFISQGSKYGLIPCGLAARDTLRLEAAMPLYGHEMTENINPYETGLEKYVKIRSINKPKNKRVGLKITGRGIARENCSVYDNNSEKIIGHITSGTYCPYLKGAYAMALVDIDHSENGTIVNVDVRGNLITAEVVPLPFYKKINTKGTLS